ncbi:MAG: carbohydrate kinase family protein, partial [Lachnospiraceae bacterium]|nr:carbohydrate kinase family protein [Lachnospiraceae bacterium]
MSKFIVAGITQIETLVRVSALPIDDTPMVSRPNSIFTAPGGDAYNTSLALQWLGNEVYFMSVVGKNQDLRLFNPPDREVTISTDYILPILLDTPTEVMLYDKYRNQQKFEDHKDLRQARYDMLLVEPLMPQAEMLVLSNANFCRPFIHMGKEAGKKIAVKIHGFFREKELYNTDFLENAAILYFSDDTLMEHPHDFIRDIVSSYDPEIIILGQGSQGVTLYDKYREMEVHYNTVTTNYVVNTAGAGNALFACFLHYYLAKKDSVYAI